MPTAYTILFCLIIFVAVTTWFIPAGSYDYADGVPVSGSYHTVDPAPQGAGAVLKAALPLCKGKAPLIVVHFHGLDDREHDVGSRPGPLREKLRELDRAVEKLCDAFHGHVILCADHGAHCRGKGGEHGGFTRRDMYVPLGEAEV